MGEERGADVAAGGKLSRISSGTYFEIQNRRQKRKRRECGICGKCGHSGKGMGDRSLANHDLPMRPQLSRLIGCCAVFGVRHPPQAIDREPLDTIRKCRLWFRKNNNNNNNNNNKMRTSSKTRSKFVSHHGATREDNNNNNNNNNNFFSHFKFEFFSLSTKL